MGKVFHSRREHAKHAFAYRMGWILADLDSLQEGAGSRGLVGGRGSAMQILSEDHLEGLALPWRQALGPWLERAGLSHPARVDLLTLPRVAGRVFNPASFWFGRDRDDRLLWMIVEIDNTFGERHLVPLDATGFGEGSSFEWIRPKRFPVSPFHDVSGEYHIRLHREGDRLRIGIDLHRTGKEPFRSSLDLRVAPVRGVSGFARVLAVAATTVATVPLILLHALVLHLRKGVPTPEWPETRDPWTIRKGPAVFLQRLFAGDLLGPLWKRLASRRPSVPQPSTGALHGR